MLDFRAVVFVLCGESKTSPSTFILCSYYTSPRGLLTHLFFSRSTANDFKPPSNFIAGRPKAALLFWFFGGFRCSVWLFVFLLHIKIDNR